MPARGKGKRTNLESKAFKSKIIKLRSQHKSVTQIGQELGVSRQYVSAVLIKAGLGIRAEQRARKKALIAKKQALINCQMRAEKERVEQDISRLEQKGEHTLASWLRDLARRRKK